MNALHRLLGLVSLTIIAGCTADFVDVEKQNFKCDRDEHCSGDRECFNRTCIDPADNPLPAYGIFIKDVSEGDSCTNGSPGSDLFAVVAALKNGPIVAVGSPVSRQVPNGRGFVFGTGMNDYTDVNGWNNALLAEGQSYLASCPEFQPRRVVSMGCSGQVFIAFHDAPWQADTTPDNFALTEEHEILVYEYGRNNCEDNPPTAADLRDEYAVQICPRTVYPAGNGGWNVNQRDCPTLLESGSGYSIVQITASAFGDPSEW